MAIKHISDLRFAFWLVLFITGCAGVLKASHETGTTRLSSPTATLNSVLFIQDNKFPAIASMPSTATWGFYDKSYTNRLILGINRYSTVALADFVATVTVQITSTTPLALGGASAIVTKTLSVSYEGANDHTAASPHVSIDQDVYTFSNGYQVSAKITGISVSSSDPSLTGSTLPSNVYLEAQTDAERYYSLTQNAAPFASATDVSILYLPASDEFEISWVRIPGAEEYDLEWLWLDAEKNNFWQNTPQLDFRNNSTRVRTSQQSYRISNVFEKGQVCFRIRGVGRASLSANAWEKTAYTPWSWQDLTTISSSGLSSSAIVLGPVTAPSSGNDYLFYITLDGVTAISTTNPSLPSIPLIHEFNKNWQYKATYAEEGKKKEVISYFDGSLRNRQAVTKNNSDNNAIVGETYYDYNGRAAVQALPVPVSDATIKFYQYNVGGYSAFNFDDANHKPYGKKYFDEEAAVGSSTNCSVFVGGLDPDYGSSNYYSDHNLNQQFAQGYVPNAENLPISQTVYTNDNTGRIAAQGGVGKTHQIGMGHETKYFYGSPEQVELDRLFGSEVGYNQHYKKNMVVDANGQVSISYIDQEGRTIATALSGQAPGNLSSLKDWKGNVLYEGAYGQIDADLLNKADSHDYDTNTDNNLRVGDRLSFSKKILVPTAGTYTISYNLKGTAFTYSCLPTNACYDCVYDLEINILDNCMNNPPGFTKITQTLGNIIPPSSPGGNATSSYSLDTQCNQEVEFATSQLSHTGDDLLVDLAQGEYTIIKTLKINQDALSFYLDDYLKSDCVKQPSDFANIAPDTSGCGLTCDQCVAALGTVSSYTASGKGTVDDWQREYNICREPCEYVSLCDAEYATMLADVSPGGQYGDWEDNNGACNPSLHTLSVYNVNNALPKIKNFTIGYRSPDWKNPFLRKSVFQSNALSAFEQEYRDDDGAISKVYVTKVITGSTVSYFPPVQASATPTAVNAMNTGAGAQYYVKPQELANVADFIANWQNSWAKSLVFYHPEYPYYDWCLKNSTDTLTTRYGVTVGTGTNAVTGYVTNSDQYDSLLMITDDILTTSGLNLTKLCDPLNYDPYWAKNGRYYDYGGAYPTTAVLPTFPQKTGTTTTGITNPWNVMYKSIDSRYNNYNQSISVPAFAALITTSCVIQYGQPAANQLGCLVGILNGNGGAFTTTSVNNVGFDAILPYMPANLKNDYWNRFKSIYLSLKGEMQMEAAESYAMNGHYRGVNDGIGNPSFDPQSLSVPFTRYFIFSSFTSFTDIFKQWYFPFYTANEPQYCTPFTGNLYAQKIKRFPNVKSATNLANNMPGGDPGAQIYSSTGLCPNAFYFQNFLNAIAVNNQLTSPTLNLSTIPEFNQDLYTVVANGVIPSSFVAAGWTASNTSNALTASMQIGSNPACGMTLNFPTGYPFNFSNTGNAGTYAFVRLYHLTPGTASGGVYNFTIRADVALNSGSAQTFTTVTLSGTTCIPLTGCTFVPPCEPTPGAIALQKLLNAIAATGNMCTSGTPVSMSNTTIQPYFLNIFGTLLGAGNWEWSINGTLPNFIIKDAGGTNTNSITITLSTAPCTSGSQHSFSNVSGSTSGTNVFHMTLSTITTGTAVSTVTAAITGTVNANGQPLKMGECSFDLAKCNTPAHQVRETMETFLAVPATRTRLQAASTNFTSIFNFGFPMRDQLVGNYQTYNTSTQATNPLYYYWKRNTAASTATLLTGHFMASTLTSVPAPDASACSFSLSFADPGSVSGQNLLSSAYTLSNFTLAPGPMVNNSVYDFSVTATFGGTPFILNGSSSCFGMRSCDECIAPPVNLSGSTAFMMNDFPCAGAPSFTVSHSGGSYTNTLTACTGTPTLTENDYSIQSTATFDTGSSNLVSYDGSSLYWLNNVGFMENKYRQSYTSQYSCNNARITFKVKDIRGGSVGYPYLPADFRVRANNVVSSNVTSTALSGDWTEFSYGTFSVVAGQPFSLEIAAITHSDRYLIIDEIQLVLPNECLQVPCVSADSIAPFPEVEYEDPCVQYALDAAENEGAELYNAYVDSVKNAFTKAYIDKCIGQAVENMYMKYNAGDYHFTLYYYDQAGNLVRTVPPQGVHVETNPANLATIVSERANNVAYGAKTYYTSHTLPTTYSYNSLNQLVKQETPDAGISRFWYDALGRLVASQNAKQASLSGSGSYVYSFTRYDYLGRIAQVGQMTIASDLSTMTATAVASLVVSGTGAYPDNLTSDKIEVTTTYYGDDASFTPLVSGSNFSAGSQEYLRSRVAAVTIEDEDDFNATTYNHGTHYSYDVHGNVKELVQENKDMTLFPTQQVRKIAYGYDLISGKVNEAAYQKGLEDMFLHRYEYDADNRITAVYTSKNNVVWDRDAKYFYYLHGPLARVETGHDKVQGSDYAYTLHGWIKGVNSNNLDSYNDMGKDSYKFGSSSTVNSYNARDVFGYSLTYYEDRNNGLMDYTAINGITGNSGDFIADVYSAGLPSSPDLFNGNIRRMVSSYLDGSAPGKNYDVMALLRDFTYDQLNRIGTASANNKLDPASNKWGTLSTPIYYEKFSYDQNGNILGLQRNGDQGGSLAMDDLVYHYIPTTNQLEYVRDAVSGDPYTGDISDQAANNYGYDAIGNLIRDDAEGISSIDWTVYGKIKSIKFNNGKPDLRFQYDASGNRISKTSNNAGIYHTTYYVRDAQGNVMATYEENWDKAKDKFDLALSEQHIYGSSRLGMVKNSLDLTHYANTPLDISSIRRELGFKNYELNNHLGNVLAVVSDRKIAVDASNDGTTDYFTGEIISATDYYSFGSAMPGRNFSANNYRYGFNGKENDMETGTQDYGMRIYNPALGRFLSKDPIGNRYPSLTPYQFASNHPINSVDIDGLEADAKFDGYERQDRLAAEQAGFKGEEANDYIQSRRNARGIGALIGASIVVAGYAYAEIPLIQTMVSSGVVAGSTSAAISAMKGESATKITTSFFSGFVSGAILGVGPTATFGNKVFTGTFSGVVGEYTQQMLDIFTGDKKDLDFLKMAESAGLGSIASGTADVLKDKIKAYIEKKVSEEVTRLLSTENVTQFVISARKANPGLSQRELVKYAKTELMQAAQYAKDFGVQLNVIMAEAVDKSLDEIKGKIQEKIDQIKAEEQLKIEKYNQYHHVKKN